AHNRRSPAVRFAVRNRENVARRRSRSFECYSKFMAVERERGAQLRSRDKSAVGLCWKQGYPSAHHFRHQPGRTQQLDRMRVHEQLQLTTSVPERWIPDVVGTLW